ncbi:MAG: cyclic nucleotide-binding domain-containing protein [Gammaproteobacteria bacterium]|nr:cyclic nucleotide-binding domain-containing protein [Gammaproteobacteria bacterium]
MSTTNIYEIIVGTPFAEDLDSDQCASLADRITTRTLHNNEILIKEGDVDSTLYIVAEGMLAVERISGGGDPVTLHILRKGDLAGEMGFVDGAEHTATLRSVGDTLVVSLTRRDLESFLTAKPEIVYGVMRGIIRAVHRILARMNLQSIELNNYITKSHGRY